MSLTREDLDYVRERVQQHWEAEWGDTLDLVEAIDRVIALHRPSTDHAQWARPYCVGCHEAGGEDGAPLHKDCPTLAAIFPKE